MLSRKKIILKYSVIIFFLLLSNIYFKNLKNVYADYLKLPMNEFDVKIGEGYLKFFGIKIYKAKLFSSKNFNKNKLFENKFALDIKYFKNFTSSEIAKISIKEINKLKLGNKVERDSWFHWMKNNFPNISKNDSLIGVFSPKDGFTLYYNNVYFASNSDIEFSKSFFSIWLDKKTSESGLRKKLLKINQ